MKHFHLKRLLKLANHLKSNKLGHKRFSFKVTNIFVSPSGEIQESIPYKCGTNGCAIGECPIVFPKDWLFSKGADPVLRRFKEQDISWQWYAIRPSIMEFFGITDEESKHLFMPDEQMPVRYGGVKASETASPKLIARNILAFIKKKEQQLAGK